MVVRKTLYKRRNHTTIYFTRTLIDLKYIRILSHIITIDGEGNDHFNIISLAETRQRLHHLGIERTKDDIHLISLLL